jgi:hypothetical protein
MAAMTDEEVLERRREVSDAIQVLCRAFGPDMAKELVSITATVGDLLVGTRKDGSKVTARVVCC